MVRTSLRPRPHRYLLPRPDQRPRGLIRRSDRLRYRCWPYRYHVCHYSSYCCTSNPDNRRRYWQKLVRTVTCTGISRRRRCALLRCIVVFGVASEHKFHMIKLHYGSIVPAGHGPLRCNLRGFSHHSIPIVLMSQTRFN